jgi:hypothetical protein
MKAKHVRRGLRVIVTKGSYRNRTGVVTQPGFFSICEVLLNATPFHNQEKVHVMAQEIQAR